MAIEELFARRGICEEYNGTKNGAEQWFYENIKGIYNGFWGKKCAKALKAIMLVRWKGHFISLK